MTPKPEDKWKVHCPWCGVHLSELTGKCHCGRTPLPKQQANN